MGRRPLKTAPRDGFQGSPRMDLNRRENEYPTHVQFPFLCVLMEPQDELAPVPPLAEGWESPLADGIPDGLLKIVFWILSHVQSLQPGLCDPAFVYVFGVKVYQPTLFPLCVLAAIIGFGVHRRIKHFRGVVGHEVYGRTFLLFGSMMCMAFVANCITYYRQSPSAIIASWIDQWLTSCCAFTFLFCGLVDLGMIRETSPWTRLFQYAGYGVMFLIYGVIAILEYTFGALGFALAGIFYAFIIAISCPPYLVMEVYSLFFTRKGPRGACWLIATGLFGLAGALCFSLLGTWLCDTLGPLWDGPFWWFLFSDLAMLCLFHFFLGSHVPPKEVDSDSLAPQLSGYQYHPEMDDEERLRYRGRSVPPL